jgi:hypothetical protein
MTELQSKLKHASDLIAISIMVMTLYVLFAAPARLLHSTSPNSARDIIAGIVGFVFWGLLLAALNRALLLP